MNQGLPPAAAANRDESMIPTGWLRRIPAATIAAAAAVLATTSPEWGDPQKLLAALQLANRAAAAPDTASHGPRLLTLQECANRLTTCRRTVQNLIANGALPARKQGSRFVRIREQDLETFINEMPPRVPRAGLEVV